MTHQSLKLLVISMGFIIILMSGLLVGLLLFKPAVPDITHLPEFGMEGLGSIDLAPQDGQDIYAVNLFASWCKPCRAEVPQLHGLSKHMAVYGIAVKDARGDANVFLAETGNPYTQIGYDYAGIMVDALGASGVPETFIVRKNGEIIRRYPGALNRAITKDYIALLTTDISD